MSKNITKRNIACSIILQLATIASGFVIPKIILSLFGSSVNGLVSSINQILNYISLLEGGIGSVIMAALYKPLVEHDEKKVSGIVNATSDFFKKIGYIYIVYLVIVALIYPKAVDTGYKYSYSVCLILVLGLNLITQYFFSIQYKLLLNADKKVYYVSIVQTIVITLNLISVIILSRLFPDILIIKLGSAIVYFLQPILFHSYVNKNYHLDKSIPSDLNAIKHRWDGFFINLSAFIHGNTDIVILTFFSTLANVSVYSVYSMVVMAIRNLIVSISSAINPSYGHIYALGDHKKSNLAYDKFEFGINFITTVLFTITMILITPFVLVYTAGINDANYNQKIFGIILCIAEMIYCYREPSNSAIYTASKFKEVSKYAVIEAASNIIISIALVNKYGIIGVAVGTMISMLYRSVMNIIYLKDNVLNRRISKTIRGWIINFFGVSIPLIICNKIFTLTCTSYIQWILLAIKVSLIVIIFNVILNIIFNKKLFIEIVRNRIIK